MSRQGYTNRHLPLSLKNWLGLAIYKRWAIVIICSIGFFWRRNSDIGARRSFKMMKQTLFLLFVATATLAIAPQVRAQARPVQAFQGSQNVPRRPATPLSHPLPPSNGNTYSGSSYNSGSGNAFASTNRVNTYTPTRTVNPNNEITILRSEREDNEDGSYSYAFENSDGTKTEQRGYFKNAGSENQILVQEGSYSYYGPDGIMYSVTYISDENGYQPSGAHLPQLPNSGTRSTSTSTSSGFNNNNNLNRNRNTQYQRN